jgi:hypothetical protein
MIHADLNNHPQGFPERNGAFGDGGGKAAVERRRAKIPTGVVFGQGVVSDGLARRGPARGIGNP